MLCMKWGLSKTPLPQYLAWAAVSGNMKKFDQPCDLLTLQSSSHAKDKINISDLWMLQIRANLRTEREEKYYWHLCVMSLRSVWDNLISKSNTRYGNTILPPVPENLCALELTFCSSEQTNDRNLFTFPVFLRVFMSDLTATVRKVHSSCTWLRLSSGFSCRLAKYNTTVMTPTPTWWVLVELPTSKLSKAGVMRHSYAFETTEKEETT